MPCSLPQITQQDLNAGSINYEVTTIGAAANGEPVDGSSTWTENLIQDATIQIGELFCHDMTRTVASINRRRGNDTLVSWFSLYIRA